jgi:hypothetical protein
LAIQIVGQLPESRADALAILAYAEELVREFLNAGGDHSGHGAGL